MVALIVNRVPPKRARRASPAALAGEPVTAAPVWALPEDDALRYPTLAELGDALGAEVVAGDPDDLTREVRHVKVAAMSVPNLLDHVEDGTVLITPGDRPDVIVDRRADPPLGAVPSVAGVVLSGGLRPDDRVAGLIAGFAAGGKPLPMFAVDDDTFDTATTAAEVEGPITAGNERKIAAALGLFEAHVDTGRAGGAHPARPLDGRHAGDVPARADRAGQAGGRPHRPAGRHRGPGARGSRPARRGARSAS